MEYTEEQIEEAIRVFSCTREEAIATYIDKLQQDKAQYFQQTDSLAYRYKRSSEYPSIGDQLDALWKGGQDAADMLARIQEIKQKYPKQ